jgi:hypothetical protein
VSRVNGNSGIVFQRLTGHDGSRDRFTASGYVGWLNGAPQSTGAIPFLSDLSHPCVCLGLVSFVVVTFRLSEFERSKRKGPAV